MAKKHCKSGKTLPESQSSKKGKKAKSKTKGANPSREQYKKQSKVPSNLEKAKPIPPLRHPFFDGKFIRLKSDIRSQQPSFIDCIDALDRIRDMVAVCDCLQMGLQQEGVLPSHVGTGQYWMLSCMQDTLCCISKRLQVINNHQRKKHRKQINKLKQVIDKNCS